MRHVLATIESFGLNPDRLMIEITESAMTGDPRTSMEPVIDELHERGLRLAIDDFGSGHSSLSRLNQMRVSTLKIDRSFVSDVETDAGNAAIVKAVLSLGRSLGIRVVAEGVETASQASFLREHGCDMGQGYHFGRPMPAGEAEHFLTSLKPDPLIPRPCEP